MIDDIVRNRKCKVTFLDLVTVLYMCKGYLV